MTAKELAEQIWNLPRHGVPIDKYKSNIESLLSSAINEAILVQRKADDTLILSWKSLAEQAKAAAYEECAKIVYGLCSTCPDEDGDCCPASNHRAAKAIRQLSKDIK